MPYWISESLIGTPPFLLVYSVLGIVWALVILPRRDWWRKGEIVALGFAVGSALLTVIMLVLGVIGGERGDSVWSAELLLTLIGGLIVLGGGLALRKARQPHDAPPRVPFATDEKLLILLIIVALVVRWIVTAYWSFTAYDALWVYGYEGRLYFLEGFIPKTIGYYPQFIPLQYAFGQIIYGAVNDHVARASIIFLHIGSIFAAHTLGARLFNRRTGLIVAAMWALYPHVGDWSRAGDLEIPLAYFFTLSAAYFLYAWHNPTHLDRRRYALIAGLALGIGMWTKPTMGAFILGVLLLAFVEIVRVFAQRPRQFKGLLPRFEIVFLTGLACIPLGAVWYIRNIVYGHQAIDFPPTFWLTQAMQSGVEFGWLVLALIILLAFIYATQKTRPNGVLLLLGVVLVSAGILPTVLEPRRMAMIEWVTLAVGSAILAFALWRYAKAHASESTWRTIQKVGTALLLALPYFVTWFISYSYHYRLSFAIVPLLILPTAVILAHWLTLERVQAWGTSLKLVYLSALVVISVPGIVSAVYDLNGGWDYLWTDKYPDDWARYSSGNESLMNIVQGLEIWLDEHPDERLIVSAPGVDRLPFFFPQQEIRVDDTPTHLSEIEDASYFIYGHPESDAIYERNPSPQNQVLSALGRTDILRRAWGMDDGTFRYDIYELALARRWDAEIRPNAPASGEVIFGDFVQYIGHDIAGAELWENRRLVFKIYWRPLATTDHDYMTFVHLLDVDGNFITNWDSPAGQFADGYYSTAVWEVGELFIDDRGIRLPEGLLPVGENYQLAIGLYDLQTQARLPIMVNGDVIGDSLIIKTDISILETAP